ncbi:DUF3179 domain-containing protein [Terasakiella sp. A23]|uniref:DUF3179 domain-containing protein n=1 Tax=Terasakiella sp. FCG-A23 TaxID=3080561 RepID=UPI002954A62C|nr:DUF3179 domain-containing protein [Terasakiella sp. A23]MDV7338555.1 DUF3179 domain-containing protein [Terasakiella sp. A23]
MADPNFWKYEWPNTDFSKSSVEFKDVLSGGPPKDGIPAIDEPHFLQVDEIKDLQAKEGVVSVEVDGVARAYPLRILMWHEIVNDEIAGVPVAVTYCPLCNAALVFDRRLPDGRVLDFGTTGKLRNSDLIMYDRQTETWWQQFMGEAIVGELQGTLLPIIPSRLESWSLFKERHPNGEVLIPNQESARDYGRNPYVGYAKSARPFLYGGDMPKGIAPMAPVLVIGDKAWSVELIKSKVVIETDGMVIEWQAGLASALDGETVFQGDDVGNIIVQKKGKDIAHHVTFAFAYHAFHPDKQIIVD